MASDDLLKQGIDLANRGDLERASSLLAQAVQINPRLELGWLWLGRCRAHPPEKEYCFKRALALNPLNQEARQELERLHSPTLPPFAKEKNSYAFVISPKEPPGEPKSSPPQDRTRKRRVTAFLAGLLVALLLIGLPLISLVASGKFFQVIDSYHIALGIAQATATSSVTPSPFPTYTLSPTYPPSPSEGPRINEAQPYIAEAILRMNQGAFPQAIEAWNQALAIVPGYDEGYFLRGKTYFRILASQVTLPDYSSHLQLAGQDFDTAIQLNPNGPGQYYLERAHYYDKLALIQTTRVDKQQLHAIALENLKVSLQRGNWENLSKREAIFYLLSIGRCDEAMAEADSQFAEQTEPSATLNTGKSLAYYCKGDLDQALTYINKALEIKDDCYRELAKAKILYSLERYSESKSVVDGTLTACPTYDGVRYYLRALNQIELGDLKSAQDDLELGRRQTWSRGGLFLFVQARLALEAGDQESALSLLQEAEASYLDIDPILEKIRGELTALGGIPLVVTPSVSPVTPMPNLTQPTSTPFPFLPTPIPNPDNEVTSIEERRCLDSHFCA